eukprot:scaffold718_cov342-Pavlova_lutheri.AAC.31
MEAPHPSPGSHEWSLTCLTVGNKIASSPTLDASFFLLADSSVARHVRSNTDVRMELHGPECGGGPFLWR